MFEWLTPAERRGGAVLVGLLMIGTIWDAWHAPSGSRSSPGGGRVEGTFDVRPAVRVDSAPTPVVERTLDLNQASAAELDALPGIGPVLATRIIAQRERGGPFRRLEDLMAVRGVGPRLLERLRSRVRLGPPQPAAERGVQSAPRPPEGRADSTSVPPRPSR